MALIKKNDTTLVIALSLPLLMILFVVASIYVPNLFSHPKFNFIYGMYGDLGLEPAYRVVNNKLVDNSQQMNPISQSPQFDCVGDGCKGDGRSNPSTHYAFTQLYEYNVATKQSIALTPSQAQQFTLSSNVQSPDGYTIQNGSSEDGFLFFGGDYYNNSDEYLVGHNVSNKINYIMNASIPDENFYFVGWIIH